MRVGYARVSTTEQSLEGQLERLSNCERVFAEQFSGAYKHRHQLQACLGFVRAGDVLVVTRLDRLARSVSHLCTISETLATKGVELVVLDQAIDTGTATGRLLFHVLAAIAEFELDVRRDAMMAGISLARARGTQMGRARALTFPQQEELARMFDAGASQSELARRFHISSRTVRRYLEESRITA